MIKLSIQRRIGNEPVKTDVYLHLALLNSQSKHSSNPSDIFRAVADLLLSETLTKASDLLNGL